MGLLKRIVVHQHVGNADVGLKPDSVIAWLSTSVCQAHRGMSVDALTSTDDDHRPFQGGIQRGMKEYLLPG
jgi:hypothetical protein